MKLFIIIGLLITLLSSIASILIIAHYSRIGDKKLLTHLNYVIFYLNLIWYLGLILQFSKTFRLNYLIETGSEILLSSLLFITRFLFLIAFFKLIEQILNLKLLKQIISPLKIAAIVIISIWGIGWLEIPVFGSNGIVTNLMIYTDILIFVSIIIICFYLIFQVKLIADQQSRTIIIRLSMVFIIPIALACLKWIIGGSFKNELIERFILHSFVFLINGLIIWWVLAYGKSFKIIQSYKKEMKESDYSKLISKYNISKRELDVIQLICEGKTNKEIADKLFISVDTVKDHNNRIFQKTGVTNRTQLARLFYK